MQAPVSPYVVVIRVAAILGMAFALALGILLALAGSGFWLWSAAAFLAFFPFLGLMVLVEKYADR
jgi:hypothetical protein